MKKFAFFLPQFHTIPENDEWWGEGFTEWTNVRKAKPLYKGHVQPKHPLDDNYYNLLDKDTMIWQTQLMNKYHVDGLVYYHYFFEGHLLLEKPAENLLKWKEINQPFFFCWANHTWYKSSNGSKKVLMEQTYGDEKIWEKHFEYLLPFFKDERYEKRNNKPLFMIFDYNIPNKNEMFAYFDARCKENGFDGISVIETFMGESDWPKDFNLFQNKKSDYTELTFLREYLVSGDIYKKKLCYYPHRIVKRIIKDTKKLLGKPYVQKYKGDFFYKIIRKYEPRDKSLVHGIFFEWDNTPRHGFFGNVITAPSKQNFIKTMDSLREDEYVFINAWNEWAEGMVLEPSKENGYKYLEWIKEWSETNE